MPSFHDPSVAQNLFSELLQRPVQAIQRITEGRNSLVYQIHCHPMQQYIGKFYFQSPKDLRDRLGVEFQTFTFLHDHHITTVPRPICKDQSNKCAIYERIHGRKLTPNDIQPQHIEQCIGFLKDINRVRQLPSAKALPEASASFFSLAQFGQKMYQRISRLQSLPQRLPVYQEMHHFVSKTLIPALHTYVDMAADKYSTLHWTKETPLPQSSRILSPSDFGFHNALLTPDNRLYFLDFEYFGWDDPAKTIADFILHPAMQLSPSQKQSFIDSLLSHFSIPYIRFQALYPLVTIQWCLIVLNEFIHSERDKRHFSRGESEDISLVCAQQLLKSRALLQSLQVNPYGS